jgi:hypothetical protein
VGTVVGIGLLTALAGATEVNMIVTGAYTVVGLGKITPEVMLAVTGPRPPLSLSLLCPLHCSRRLVLGMIIIAISLHYHVKGAFCLALLIGTVIWWTLENSWPTQLIEFPHLAAPELSLSDTRHLHSVLPLYLDLLFLYVLTLSGLIFSLSALANLVREDGTTPRNRWIFIICGLMTVLSGLLGGPPILLSPESAAGIKAGARTGLSSIVCGGLFGLSVFFAPILKAIPSAATSPVLIIVGVFLFQNVIRVDWTLIKDSVPAFCILFFIPFTYSVLQGVAMGYFVYLVISLATGDLLHDCKRFWHEYSDHANEPLEGAEAEAEMVSREKYHSLFHGACSNSPDPMVQQQRSLYQTPPPTGRSIARPGVGDEPQLAPQFGEDVERGERARPRRGFERVPIRNRYRGFSIGDSPGGRGVSSPMRQSMDGLDYGVQVNSGVLERPRDHPPAHQMARSLPGNNLTFI